MPREHHPFRRKSELLETAQLIQKLFTERELNGIIRTFPTKLPPTATTSNCSNFVLELNAVINLSPEQSFRAISALKRDLAFEGEI